MKTVTVKCQRPLFTSGSWLEVLSYIVDEDDERVSNPNISQMKAQDVKEMFGEYHKVYYLAKYTTGRPLQLIKPTRKGEWQ